MVPFASLCCSGEDCADTADKEPKQQQTEEEEKKKKKNKKRRDKAGFKYEEVDPIAKVNALPEEKIQEVRKAVRLFLASQGPARTLEEAGRRSYPFWDTQPVPKIGETVTSHCCIVPDASGVREEPLSLPPGFSWDSLDLERLDSLKELHVLLSENYEEDDDAAFRLACGPQFLLWALRPPGRLPRWHCAVRADSGRKLVGFIGAAALDVRIHDTRKTMAHVKLLCVHKKLRKKRMAPVLIREMARRARLDGVFQGVYAAGPVLPKPVSTCRFWHRYLNPRKLIEVKFSHLSKNMTVQRALKLYRLPETTKTQGLRPMTREDVPAVHLLLRDYLDQFQLVPIMSAEEVEHWLLPRHEVVSTYVVESVTGSVTDFVSFVTLPSTILNHPVHRSIKAARSFYTVHTRTPLVDLVEDALILAKAEGFDVFTALDLMENKTFLENLKFVIGDDRLNYYLYNWKCPGLRSEKVGFLLH